MKTLKSYIRPIAITVLIFVGIGFFQNDTVADKELQQSVVSTSTYDFFDCAEKTAGVTEIFNSLLDKVVTEEIAGQSNRQAYTEQATKLMGGFEESLKCMQGVSKDSPSDVLLLKDHYISMIELFMEGVSGYYLEKDRDIIFLTDKVKETEEHVNAIEFIIERNQR